MTVVVEIVCFIKARSLHHRQFKTLLEELDSSKSDLVLHTEVRWSSRAKVLLRFCELLSEIRTFLASKNKEYDQLNNPDWLLNLAFLTDISQHLDSLNQQLQGENKTLPVMYAAVEAFQRKLTLFSAQMTTNNYTHFPFLANMVKDVDSSSALCREQQFSSMIDVLATDFENRFKECRSKKSMFQFTVDPFSFQGDLLTEFIPVESIAAAQLALLELQSDPLLSRFAEINCKDC